MFNGVVRNVRWSGVQISIDRHKLNETAGKAHECVCAESCAASLDAEIEALALEPDYGAEHERREQAEDSLPPCDGLQNKLG